jgi:hypothetical protein
LIPTDSAKAQQAQQANHLPSLATATGNWLLPERPTGNWLAINQSKSKSINHLTHHSSHLSDRQTVT